MKKRIMLTTVLLLIVSLPVWPIETQTQFFGTHAFGIFNDNFIFSDAMGFSYVKNDLSIAIYATRTSVPLSRVQSDLDSSNFISKIPDGNGRATYLFENSRAGIRTVRYLLPLGNEIESAVVTGIILNSTNIESSRSEILELLGKVSWEENSSLNFEGAQFFDSIPTLDLSPALILGNRIFYTPNGKFDSETKFQVYFGKNHLAPIYRDGKNGFYDYFLKVESQGVTPADVEVKDIAIDSVKGKEFSYSYSQGDQTTKKIISVIVIGDFMYFIGEESTDRQFDNRLEEYDKIIDKFHLKDTKEK